MPLNKSDELLYSCASELSISDKINVKNSTYLISPYFLVFREGAKDKCKGEVCLTLLVHLLTKDSILVMTTNYFYFSDYVSSDGSSELNFYFEDGRHQAIVNYRKRRFEVIKVHLEQIKSVGFFCDLIGRS